VLYLLCGKPGSLAVKQDWEVLAKIWPVLLRTKSSEKPSIIALVDRISRLIQEGLDEFQLQLEV
jgi:hypothetical protein